MKYLGGASLPGLIRRCTQAEGVQTVLGLSYATLLATFEALPAAP